MKSDTMSETVIETAGLGRRFGADTALDGVDIAVPRATVLGLLGHNGSGKTTLVNVLATRLQPSSGRAWVAGYDVVRDPGRVREHIGLTAQFAALDEHISGRDNLELIARLLGAGRREARRRADELLEAFGLTELVGRPARHYSGGMRRRLDVAVSLVGHPDVLFLDEPTTGLDPASRNEAWRIVRSLVDEGTTVLLTTQYLDEADRYADSVVVLKQGRVLARGTPSDLKSRVGAHVVTVRPASRRDVPAILAACRRVGARPTDRAQDAVVTVPVSSPGQTMAVVRGLDGIAVQELLVSEPNLDDAYLAVLRRHEAGGPR